jgi:hypothetical protein
VRKHFVIQRKRIVDLCSLEGMEEGTHQRFNSFPNLNGTGGINSFNASNPQGGSNGGGGGGIQLPNKFSDPTIVAASSDSVTNGIVMRSPRKFSHDPPPKPDLRGSGPEGSGDEKEEEGGGGGGEEEQGEDENESNRMKSEEKDIRNSPRTEEIREQTPIAAVGGVEHAAAAVVPVGYGSHQIKLGTHDALLGESGFPSHHPRGEEIGDRRPSIVSYDLGMSGKQIDYALLPQDPRLRTSSEIPIHDLPDPQPQETGASHMKSDHHQRPKYRGAFSFQESGDEGGEGERRRGDHEMQQQQSFTNQKRKVLQRKLSKKMSGTMKRIFSRVVSHSFSLAYDDSSDDFDSSDFSDSRFSFDSDDEDDDESDNGHGHELDVISIDKKIAQPSRKKFPTSP